MSSDFEYRRPEHRSIWNGNPTKIQIVSFVLTGLSLIGFLIVAIWLFRRTKNRGKEQYRLQQAQLQPMPIYAQPPPVYESYGFTGSKQPPLAPPLGGFCAGGYAPVNQPGGPVYPGGAPVYHAGGPVYQAGGPMMPGVVAVGTPAPGPNQAPAPAPSQPVQSELDSNTPAQANVPPPNAPTPAPGPPVNMHGMQPYPTPVFGAPANQGPPRPNVVRYG